jgi:hypothetical protein
MISFAVLYYTEPKWAVLSYNGCDFGGGLAKVSDSGV